jgi:hypothetical protein
LLAHHTGQAKEQIATDTDRDYILGAEEAIAYGLIDEVLTPRRTEFVPSAVWAQGKTAQETERSTTTTR